MGEEIVRGSDGTLWSVRVEFLPRWRYLSRRLRRWKRTRKREGRGDWGGLDVPDIGGDDLFVALGVVVGLVVAVVLGWFVVVPVLLLMVDAVTVVVLVVVAVVARFLLGRPWTVRARPVDGPRAGEPGFAKLVVGHRAARRLQQEFCTQLADGPGRPGRADEVDHEVGRGSGRRESNPRS